LTQIKAWVGRLGLTASMRTRIIPLLTTLTLALAMVFGAVAQGMAQATALRGPVFEMVICSAEGGESVIVIDAAGNRVEPDQHCPPTHCRDCLVSTVSAPVDISVTARFEPSFTDEPMLVSFFVIAQRRFAFQTARGPPQKN
jgi:hypothetical protein